MQSVSPYHHAFSKEKVTIEMLHPINLTLLNNNFTKKKGKNKTFVHFPPAVQFQNLGQRSSKFQTNLSVQSTWKSGTFLCDTASCKLRTTSCTVAVFPVPGTPLIYMHLEHTQCEIYWNPTQSLDMLNSEVSNTSESNLMCTV